MSEEKIEWFIDLLIRQSVKVFVGILIIVVGFWLANRLKKIIRNRMVNRNVDASIREFILPVISVVFKIMVILSAVSTVGIKVTSFAAIMAGLAAGVGLSLQGSLSNFAGGLLIILFKPFKVGDYIVALEKGGTVESISILYTTLVTPDHVVITLPNSTLLNNPVTNYSIKDTRRLVIKVGISYSDDMEKAQQVLKDMLKEEPMILKDQEVVVEVLEFAETSINLAVWGFVKRDEYWKAYYKLYKKTKEKLDENDIKIPFPQSIMRILPTDDKPTN